jgi:flagellar basal body-associated protein FliL
MLKNKKVLLAIVPILAFAAYTMTKPKPVNKDKIKGIVYVMPQQFLLNLTDGRYAKISVALELAPGQSDGAAAGAAPASGESAAGTLPEEPVVREIVTNDVTNQSGEALVSSTGRRAVKRDILRDILQQTDLKVQAVLFPDLTVQ